MRVCVVGAGPAGCLTARRLADAHHEVVLFEAGGRVEPTLDFAVLLDRPEVRWPESSRPPVPSSLPVRGRAVGGGSAINGLLLSAPDPIDLADWERRLGLSAGAGRFALERVITEIAPQVATPGPLARRLGASIDAGAPTQSTIDVGATGLLAAVVAARSGERRDAAAVYLDDAPSTLEVRTGVEVESLSTLTGFDHCVVSAGALASPALVRSVMPDLAAQPAQIHDAVGFVVELDEHERVSTDTAAVTRVFRWSTGIDDSDRPDAQLVLLDHLGWSVAGRRQGLVIAMVLPGVAIDPAERSGTDRARMRGAVRRAGELLGVPLPAADPALDRWIDGQPNPVHHPTSTLPLGTSLPSGITVIDASVFPTTPRADTMLPTLVMAELLSARLLTHLS